MREHVLASAIEAELMRTRMHPSVFVETLQMLEGRRCSAIGCARRLTTVCGAAIYEVTNDTDWVYRSQHTDYATGLCEACATVAAKTKLARERKQAHVRRALRVAVAAAALGIALAFLLGALVL